MYSEEDFKSRLVSAYKKGYMHGREDATKGCCMELTHDRIVERWHATETMPLLEEIEQYKQGYTTAHKWTILATRYRRL